MLIQHLEASVWFGLNLLKIRIISKVIGSPVYLKQHFVNHESDIRLLGYRELVSIDKIVD